MIATPEILYIEDNESFAKLVSACLEDCHIDSVKTYKDGLARLNSDMHFDLVLLNMNLTEYGDDNLGLEILKHITKSRPVVPRVVITGADFPFTSPVVSGFLQKYNVNELIHKEHFKGNQLREVVRKLTKKELKVEVRQIHIKIPKSIIHFYQSEKFQKYPALQLFELIIESHSPDLTDVSVVIGEHSYYIQKNIYKFQLKTGENHFFLSPVFTGKVGDDDGIVVISDFQILFGEQCIWKSKDSYKFKVVNTIPIQLKQAATGNEWVHFLITTCITPNSPEITALAGKVRQIWRKDHSKEIRRASQYTTKDALTTAKILRELLKEKLVTEGIYFPSTPQQENLVEHVMKMPDEILKNKGANCLYYSIVYASVLESLGIHPLLLFIPGHVVPGWKTSHSIDEDYTFEPNKFLLLEKNCTFFESTKTSDNDISFDEMIEDGKKIFLNAKQLYKNEQPVHLIDIANLRLQGIYP